MIEPMANHSMTQMRPAVFLDRDGVLCTEKGYVIRVEELELVPFAKACIDLLHQCGFLTICITNQSAVARGMMSEEALQRINRYLLQELSLDALYYCPHYPSAGGKFGVTCNCRKPKTGMIEQAVREFYIDRERSYLVGDRASDILCGQNAGVKTVLVESGYGTERLEQSVQADFVCDNLLVFVKKIYKECI